MFVFVPITLSTTTPRAPMPLFEVPDWNISSSIQSSVQSAKPNKKRKRSAYEEDVRLGEAAFNFEKLVKQLEEGGSASPKGKKKARSENLKSEKKTESASSKSDRRPEGKKERKEKQESKERHSKNPEDNTVVPPKKKRKKENKSEQTPVSAEDKPKPQNLSKKSKSFKGTDLTPLQSKMKATLDGARFRYVSPQG
jgi:ribosomal RNA-processing protein 8